MTSTRRVTVSAWVLAAASLTVGCQSGDGKSTETPVPKTCTSSVFDHVTYPDGKPDGLLGNDPWVRTVYTYEAELAWARAHYDWTSPQLTKVASSKTVSFQAWGQLLNARRHEYDRVTPAGPRPITVKSQRINEHGTSVITACRASGWYVFKGNVVPGIATTKGNYVEYTVSIADENYAYIMGESNYSTKPCDVTGAKPSYFDPAPQYAEPAEGDIKITDAIRDY